MMFGPDLNDLLLQREIFERSPHAAILLKYKGRLAKGVSERLSIGADGCPCRIAAPGISWVDDRDMRLVVTRLDRFEQMLAKCPKRSVVIAPRQQDEIAVTNGRPEAQSNCGRDARQPFTDATPVANLILTAKRYVCRDQLRLPWIERSPQILDDRNTGKEERRLSANFRHIRGYFSTAASSTSITGMSSRTG